jgi:hypothetical protein
MLHSYLITPGQRYFLKRQKLMNGKLRKVVYRWMFAHYNEKDGMFRALRVGEETDAAGHAMSPRRKEC